MEKLFIMLQMLNLNLAEQYIQNLPIGWVFCVWIYRGYILEEPSLSCEKVLFFVQ